MLSGAIAGFLARGYATSAWTTSRCADDPLAVAKREGRLHRNFQGYSTQPDCDLVALGVSAISKLGASFPQNVKTLPEYYAALREGRLPVERGLALDQDDLVRRDAIMALMCQGRLDFEPIERSHGIVAAEYFAGELDRLRQMAVDGLVTIEPSAVQVTPMGWFFVRAVAMVFDRYPRAGKHRGRIVRDLGDLGDLGDDADERRRCDERRRWRVGRVAGALLAHLLKSKDGYGMLSLALAGTALVMGAAGSLHCAAMCVAPCAAVTGGRRGGMAAFQAGQAAGLRGGRGPGRGQRRRPAALGGDLRGLAAAVADGASRGAGDGGVPLLARGAAAVVLRLWTTRAPAAVGIPVASLGAGAVVLSPCAPLAPRLAGLAWLAWPCGLLHAVLTVAALAEGPWQGAGVMAAFALALIAGLARRSPAAGPPGRRGDAGRSRGRPRVCEWQPVCPARCWRRGRSGRSVTACGRRSARSAADRPRDMVRISRLRVSLS